MATRGKQGSQVVQADRALAALAFTLCVFNVFQFIEYKLLDTSYGAEHSEQIVLCGEKNW